MPNEVAGVPAEADTPSSLTEIRKGFSRLFPNFRCIFCGKQEFFLTDQADLKILTHSDKHEFKKIYNYNLSYQYNKFDDKIMLTLLICTTCGHFYPFASEILLDAVRAEDGVIDPSAP